MSQLWTTAEACLRARPLAEEREAVRRLAPLLACVVLAGMLYGAVMGTFGGLSPDRLLQVVYSAVKVPLLLLVTFLVTLPSFFVFNTLLGVRGDFREAVRALVATQAALAIVLASLAPYTALWYASSASYNAAVGFNGLMFASASAAGQWLLRRNYRPLVERNRRHRWLLWAWLTVYVFVGIQLAWTLRPFVGAPDIPTQFLRSESWGNAYVTVVRLVWRLLTD